MQAIALQLKSITLQFSEMAAVYEMVAGPLEMNYLMVNP